MKCSRPFEREGGGFKDGTNPRTNKKTSELFPNSGDQVGKAWGLLVGGGGGGGGVGEGTRKKEVRKPALLGNYNFHVLLPKNGQVRGENTETKKSRKGVQKKTLEGNSVKTGC